ncbi:hypothetical protein SAMN06264849_103139 [Melghirimyces algeriensis]|uniref:Uncharacterized protein n=1 Tax=Melghirimyces algeriensis TaxID=910412 RepID=A0A521C5K5_9BACL|nr:hypothetical protein SAMN06264849_103139 [Melghirimyces algeriensis]
MKPVLLALFLSAVVWLYMFAPPPPRWPDEEEEESE